MNRSKRHSENLTLVQSSKAYPPLEAIKLLKSFKSANFDETIEVHFNLGIDPRHADQQLRGTTSLPHGTGKLITIAVITQGENLLKATKAGADFVGGDDIIEKIAGGWMEFDLLIASPEMMSKVGRLGRALGTKGLMPNPKAGTVTPDIEKAVQEFKAGKLEYRNDKFGNLHIGIGKQSFSEQQILENFDSIYETVVKIKPSKSKGVYMKSVSLCSSMSPGVAVETQKIKWKEN
jgi:large subunit ribosomal protein L1